MTTKNKEVIGAEVLSVRSQWVLQNGNVYSLTVHDLKRLSNSMKGLLITSELGGRVIGNVLDSKVSCGALHITAVIDRSKLETPLVEFEPSLLELAPGFETTTLQCSSLFVVPSGDHIDRSLKFITFREGLGHDHDDEE